MSKKSKKVSKLKALVAKAKALGSKPLVAGAAGIILTFAVMQTVVNHASKQSFLSGQSNACNRVMAVLLPVLKCEIDGDAVVVVAPNGAKFTLEGEKI